MARTTSGIVPSAVATNPQFGTSEEAPSSRRFFEDSSRLALAIDQVRVSLIRDGLPHPLVWSARCGTGKELYSLAIATLEELGPLAARLRFLGSDTDDGAITTARHAIYSRPHLGGMREHLLQRHFRRVAPGTYAVAEAHRRRFEFHSATVHEMADRVPPASVVVALYRRDAHGPCAPGCAQCHRVIAERLVPGGLLLQSPGAPPPDPRLLERWGCRADGIFVRPRADEPRTPPVPHREQPLSVHPADAATTVPSPPRRTETRARLDNAAEHGRRGEVNRALMLATEAVIVEPNGPVGYLLRAQLQLAGGSVEGALDDLRRLVFLAPACHLGRYWYVLTLRAARFADLGLAQLAELERQLASVEDTMLLEDRATRVGDLRRALVELRAAWPETTHGAVDQPGDEEP